MIITTTSSIEGKKIKEYKGIVTGEAIMGANFIKDVFASVRDFVGGRSSSYERVLREGKQEALKELEKEGLLLNANAVVGVHLDYEALGGSGSMLMVTATGTAVVYED